jgi:hypothetical protein
MTKVKLFLALIGFAFQIGESPVHTDPAKDSRGSHQLEDFIPAKESSPSTK